MRKRLIAMVLSALLAAGALIGYSGSSGKETTPAQVPTADASEKSEGQAGSQRTADASADPSVDLIFTSVSVTGGSHTIAMTAFAEKVKKLSGGSIICKTYPDSTLFPSENEFDVLLSEDADLAYISFPTLATQSGLEWCSMVVSGHFWSSYDHMANTLNEELREEVSGNIQSQISCIPVSAFYLESRVVNTRNKKINTYEDMSGILFRMPNSEAWLNLGETLGANPTPLSFSELYAALQTGVVNAQENPLPTDASTAFYEVAPYMTIINHVIDSILPCINTDTWNGITDAQKTAVTEATEYAGSVNDDAGVEEEEEDIASLEEKGCTITYSDLVEFREKIQAYYTNHPEQTETWDVDLYNRIQAMANQEAVLISDHVLIGREQAIPIPYLRKEDLSWIA